MKNLIFAFLFFVSIFSFSFAQEESSIQKVANFEVGTMGKEDYETFSFWVNEDASQKVKVEYGYGGAKYKELTLKYLGTDSWKGEAAFKLQFKNNYVLYVIPQTETLKVVDAEGKYDKIFQWRYEGPVNGIGTFCLPCAEDATEAIKMVTDCYLK